MGPVFFIQFLFFVWESLWGPPYEILEATLQMEDMLDLPGWPGTVLCFLLYQLCLCSDQYWADLLKNGPAACHRNFNIVIFYICQIIRWYYSMTFTCPYLEHVLQGYSSVKQSELKILYSYPFN